LGQVPLSLHFRYEEREVRANVGCVELTTVALLSGSSFSKFIAATASPSSTGRALRRASF
jgi:hypothetical protein